MAKFNAIACINRISNTDRINAVAVLAQRRKAPTEAFFSFREFICLVRPGFRWSRFSELLVARLQDVADGKITRLMIFVPPRHGKSEIVSRLFTAYCLYRYPDRWVGLCSYAAELAYSFSRVARANYRDAGGTLSDDSAAVQHWETSKGGGMWAAGVGGAITGKGAHIAIVDDPLKNSEEANSPTIREKQKDWWDSTFYTRLEENAAIVVLQTRWHEDDLSGWLLSREYDDNPERWHIVSLPAIADGVPQEFPPSCTVEPDWRSEGEALNDVRISLERLLQIRSRLNGYFWDALYQQRPRPKEGNIFKESWFPEWHTLPDLEQIYISVDASFKQTKGGSFVVIQLWGVTFPRFYLLHQTRKRLGFVATKAAIRAMVDYCEFEHGQAVDAILIEDKANGPAIIDELREEFSGVIPIQPRGGKEARAEAVSPSFESGHVLIPGKQKAPFPVQAFLDEFFSFPLGAHDDQVDGATQLIYWASQRRKKHRRRGTVASRANW